MNVIFEVVGANSTTRHLLGKELNVVGKMVSPTNSIVYKLTNENKTFLLEQKEVGFNPSYVYISGLLSDEEKNVGRVQLKFKPQKDEE